MTSLFVTGTDTDVGKTFISVAIIDLLKQKGLRVAAMKPIASGCDTTEAGLRNDDALQLIQHANVDLPYGTINPYAFQAAIAPHIAAQQKNINIDLNKIKQNFELIQQQSDAVVVEGAGGWLVPINNTQTMADLAKVLKLPIILVVGIRLGCINHALLTVEAIKQSGLPLMGWVANNIEINAQSEQIVSILKLKITAPLLAEVPFLSTEGVAVDYINEAYFI
jgi:dethiobiotin synthetase